MDKGRAIIEHTLARRRFRQGTGELYNSKHIYYEANRMIEKNGWEREAEAYFLEDRKDLYERLTPYMEEYYNLLCSGRKDPYEEQFLLQKLQEYGVNGELEERVKYRVEHDNKEPSSQELKKRLEKRKEEDNMYRDIFFEQHVKIALGEDFNKEKLLEATRHLRKRGLYKVALIGIPYAISFEEAKRAGTCINDKIEFDLYP